MTGTGSRLVARLITVACFALTVSCTTVANDNAISERPRAPTAQPEYVIGLSDTISIRVLDEVGFSVEAQIVRPDGTIAFPKYGDIMVAGKTPQGLREVYSRPALRSL